MSPSAAGIPQVESFFDPVTNTVSYVVIDPQSRRCALVDSVLDYEVQHGLNIRQHTGYCALQFSWFWICDVPNSFTAYLSVGLYANAADLEDRARRARSQRGDGGDEGIGSVSKNHCPVGCGTVGGLKIKASMKICLLRLIQGRSHFLCKRLAEILAINNKYVGLKYL